ncbi:hypothetical protein O4G76_08225 [Limimaricola sp. G21655-S1]|uniref:hypothetical protein n=1 Tax=Limimaricola sp. G21655-S1 TaxID=3014768 RepID=UPI0022AE5949|nr:hypothetical protein [Limimaricola sp. G21655-S1]MCZ4260828.1 hypothetical protein [Limimaricola sp. G21655-S1]
MLHPTTTPIALLMFAAILWLGPVRGLWVFFASMTFRSAAALSLPGLGDLSLTDLCVVALWVACLGRPVGFARLFGTMRPTRAGFPLMLLMVLATIGAVFLPRVFSGQTEFFTLGQIEGRLSFLLAPLRPTGSNIGQLVRFALSVSSYVLLAAAFAYWGRPDQALRAMTISTMVHAAVSFVDLGSHAAGLPWMLEGFRTMNYAMLDDQRLMDIRRLIGGFPEPSAYAFYTVGLYGFWLKLWFDDRGGRWTLATLILVALLLLRSMSTSGIVAFVSFTGLFLLWHVRSAARVQGLASLYLGLSMAIPLAIGGVVLIYNFVPSVPIVLDTLIFNKMDSESGVERMSWNMQALRNFADSYGLGIGIGSVRASSWIMTNLGSFGLPGSLLQLWFLLALATLGRGLRGLDSAATRTGAAMVSGCMAIVLQAMIARPYPNLDTPFYAMAGVAAGLYAHARLRDRRPAPIATPARPEPAGAAGPLFAKE